MVFSVLTLFPEVFKPYLSSGVIARGIEKKIVDVRLVNIRDYASDNYKTVDDYPYGGGDGMVLKVEPIIKGFESLEKHSGRRKVLITSPGGRLFNQAYAKSLVGYDEIVIICGRYEGIDERVKVITEAEEISTGDYVLTGGELPAMVIIDATSRLLDGILGSLTSKINESFERSLLEYPQYTRPEAFRGLEVPEVLLSGNHKLIEKWRMEKSVEKTYKNRPDLFDIQSLNDDEKNVLKRLKEDEREGG